jgi:hypothetical protein
MTNKLTTQQVLSAITNAQKFSAPPFYPMPVTLPNWASLVGSITQVDAAEVEPWLWTVEEELEGNDEDLIAVIKDWTTVLVSEEQRTACTVWALTSAQGTWFHRNSELLDCWVFWFSSEDDALYVKLAFGGDV